MDHVAITERPADRRSTRGRGRDEDHQVRLNDLPDDIVFKARTPMGTSIGGEFRGKQAIADYPGRHLAEGCQA